MNKIPEVGTKYINKRTGFIVEYSNVTPINIESSEFECTVVRTLNNQKIDFLEHHITNDYWQMYKELPKESVDYLDTIRSLSKGEIAEDLATLLGKPGTQTSRNIKQVLIKYDIKAYEDVLNIQRLTNGLAQMLASLVLLENKE